MEKLRLKRTKVHHPGKVFVLGHNVHDCTVHNLTGLGICIELTTDSTQLPQTLDFSFDNFRTIHSCKIVWRQGKLAGVEFEREPAPHGTYHSGRKAKLRLVR